MVLGRLQVGDTVTASVDASRRAAVARHHSATHLLHRALCDVLGVPGPLQRGSWVGPDHTTFDFPLNRALEKTEIDQVNRLVNDHIRSALPFHEDLLPYSEAIKTRAMHLFEEKYGDIVRVVCFGDWTCEFCGGTHVHNTADIGLALIVSESSIGAGLRRVDVVAGDPAREMLYTRFEQVNQLARSLGVSVDNVPARIDELRAQLRETERKLEHARDELRAARVRGGDGVAPKPVPGTRVPTLMQSVETESASDLGRYADTYLDSLPQPGVVAVTNSNSFVIKVSRDLAAEFDANRLKDAFGRGGGPAWFVQGKLERPPEEAFARLKEMLT
jgi:alanyl-tRNA synthetase